MNSRPYWFQRHPALTLTIASACGCIILLFLAELLARSFSSQWAPVRQERAKFWRYDPLLGWAHTPNQQGWLHHKDFSIWIAINSSGMRDREYSVQRTDKKRMLVLGDSYAWGFGVEQNQSFSELLEQKHSEWEIINASVSGYSTDQEYLFLREYGIAYKPDLVLLLFCENDFAGCNTDEDNWYFKPYFVEQNGILTLRNNPVPQSTARQRLDRLIFGRTYLLKLPYALMIQASRYVKSRISSGKETPAPRAQQRSHGEYSLAASLIREINRLCTANAARLIIVSVPMPKRKRAVLRELSATDNIPYLPLDDSFGPDEARLEFPHDKHWNAKGHEAAGGAIDSFLISLDIF